MTDHLAGDNRLVTYGAMFTQDHGKLILAHVEDEQTFCATYRSFQKFRISIRILRKQQLWSSCSKSREILLCLRRRVKGSGLPLEIEPLVTIGHHLSDYKKLVVQHETDLLVLNTKDEDQLAMHGLAYPVSVELRDVPLLLI